MGSKGAAEITEVLSLIAIGASLIFFFVVIMPKFITTMFNMMAVNSADAVARNLAGFITISGAATDRITINYATQSLYTVSIIDRISYVQLLEGLKNTASARSAVTAVCPSNNQCNFDEVGRFEIKKSSDGMSNKYEVFGYAE